MFINCGGENTINTSLNLGVAKLA